MKTRRAVEAVSVEQRHGWHVELGTDRYQLLGDGCAFEEAESRTSMEFDVHQFPLKTFHHRDTEKQRKQNLMT
jgi:hypothetical protein